MRAFPEQPFSRGRSRRSTITSGIERERQRRSNDATTAGKYYKGMAVLTIVEGGDGGEAGASCRSAQKCKYKPKVS